MAFFEVEFPRVASFKSQGGPTFNTMVNTGLSGVEQRNRNWSLARAKWSIGFTTPPPSFFTGTGQDWVNIIYNFFLNVGGKADAFRFFDWVDNAAKGQTLGVGDGITRIFQLIKLYTIGGRTYTRTIVKPITSAVKDYVGNALPDTVVIYDNGVAVSSAFWSVDSTTGLVTFAVGHAPANTHVVTADFQFHYPARFDTDEWQLELEESNVKGGDIIVSAASGALPIIEVRLISNS